MKTTELTRRKVLWGLAATPAVWALGRWWPGAEAAAQAVAAAGGADDFAFIHMSDTHLDPRPFGAAYNPDGRSVRTLAWLNDYSARPTMQPVYGVEAAPPAFAIHTGDVFEYSVIAQTWSDFDRAFAGLACPLYYVPGNHDNTWGSINRRMRQRFGGDSHSFDAHGCHFVCLNSAGLLDPLPCLDRRTVEWLRADLAEVDRDAPVFLALHHPLSQNAGYASVFDRLRLWDVFRDHHVVLMMDGHWHQVHARRWQGIDRVNGGETFRLNPGYSAVTVADGRLRVMYRFDGLNPERGDERLEVPLIDKPLKRRRRSPIASCALDPVTRLAPGARLPVAVTTRGAVAAVEVFVEGDEGEGESPDVTALSEAGRDRFAGELDLAGLPAGRHAVVIRAKRKADGPEFLEGREVVIAPPRESRLAVVERRLDAGVRATPVYDAARQRLVVADTRGAVRALDVALNDVWTFDVGTEVVNGLALADDVVLIADADGVVHALDSATGQPRWRVELPEPVYGKPVVDGDNAIIGDADGFLIRLAMEDGAAVWRERIADFGFEAAGCVADGRWYGSAWDAFLYAVDLQRGETVWKSRIPTGQERSESRYYGGADTTPVILDGRLYTTDRGYTLGAYTLDGQYAGMLAEKVAACAAGPDGTALLTRHLDNRVGCLEPSGTTRWEAAAAAGRVPARPCRAGAGLVIVSDRGVLTVLSDDGEAVERYRVSPRLYVLAEPVAAWGGAVVAADMDGVVTALRWA